MRMISNVSKFSWAEMFSNDNGKTSGTAFTGIIICMVGTLCFFLGVIDKMWISKSIDVITQSITFVLIGASLMGIKKVVGSKDNVEFQDKPTSQDTPIPQSQPPSDTSNGPTSDEPPLQ